MQLSSALKAAAIAAVVASAAQASAAPVNVTPTNSAAALSSTLGGSGITISNPVYTGASGSAGTFTGGTAAGLGFNSGIVLSTGLASDAGTNYAGSQLPSTDLSGPSTSFISNSFDAATLSFDFVSTGTAASFSYVFASAEYPDYVNSDFNDAFRFLINGKDVALLPGSSTPVTINTVNAGDTDGAGASNSNLFVDNRNGQNASIPFGGYTVGLTAGIAGLTPGASNTLTLVIADVSDGILDSGVFIQGGSLTNAAPGGGGTGGGGTGGGGTGGGSTGGGTAVPEPASAVLLGAGLFGLYTARRRNRLG